MSLRAEIEDRRWCQYADASDRGTIFHLLEWDDVIRRAYSHRCYYVVALDTSTEATGTADAIADSTVSSADTRPGTNGVLPLVRIRQVLSGDALVSMPFCDAGGILASEASVERNIIERSVRLANEQGVSAIELRQYHPLLSLEEIDRATGRGWACRKNSWPTDEWCVYPDVAEKKARMVMELPSDPDALMRSFNAKLRSQIRKPSKEGLASRVGGVEMLDAFYDVFAENMRDLGSPVHSKRFFREVLRAFPDRARIFIVEGRGVPMACGLTLGFRNTLSNPWASSLRRYSQLVPNMLLYWAMLEYGCQQGYKRFDFGRSTVGEGTYRFKEQWGARPEPLFWYRFVHESHARDSLPIEGDNRRRAAEYWKRLPVSVTKVLGPRIRRYISL